MIILVHIAAPSSLHDDGRYQAQADAILRTFYPQEHNNNNNNNTTTSNSLSHDPLASASARLAPDSFDSPVSVIPESPPALYLPVQHHQHPAKRPSPDTNAHTDTHTHNKRRCPQPQRTDGLVQTPMTIHPPPPPIASTPFATHITPTLALLANRLNLARTFVPTHQARQLHVLERGYWWLRLRLRLRSASDSLPHHPRAPGPGQTGRASATTTTSTTSTSTSTGVWDHNLFTRFWTFLSDLIAKEGRAGWGVWCILDRDGDGDPPPHPPNTTTTTTTTTATNSPNLNPLPDPHPLPQTDEFILKLYTWGEIAPHVYLLLYLASERRIRGMGAQWRDASEGVVIQMP